MAGSKASRGWGGRGSQQRRVGRSRQPQAGCSFAALLAAQAQRQRTHVAAACGGALVSQLDRTCSMLRRCSARPAAWRHKSKAYRWAVGRACCACSAAGEVRPRLRCPNSAADHVLATTGTLAI